MRRLLPILLVLLVAALGASPAGAAKKRVWVAATKTTSLGAVITVRGTGYRPRYLTRVHLDGGTVSVRTNGLGAFKVSVLARNADDVPEPGRGGTSLRCSDSRSHAVLFDKVPLPRRAIRVAARPGEARALCRATVEVSQGADAIERGVTARFRLPYERDGALNAAASLPFAPVDGKPRVAFKQRGWILSAAVPDGSLARIAAVGSGEHDPMLSPDGALVSLTSNRSGSIGTCAFSFLPRLSPNAAESLCPEVWLARTMDGALFNLTESASVDVDGSFSHDGSLAVFSSRGEHFEICTIRLDQTVRTCLTDTPTLDEAEAVYSADDAEIAFTRWNEETEWVVAMDADGSNERRVSPGHGRRPAWSPNGRRLVYANQTPNVTQRLVVADLDAGTTRVVSTLDSIEALHWVSEREVVVEDESGLIALDLETLEARRLVRF